MRLIDADALLEDLKKTGRYFQAKFDIENAPTVEGNLNTAINVIKTVCENSCSCVECPMNSNCNNEPAKWRSINNE